MTVTTLTGAFNEDISQGGSEDTNSVFFGCNTLADGRFFRACVRFTVTSIPTTDTVSLVEFIIECNSSDNVALDSWYIGPYNATGQGDPQGDSGANAFSRCEISADNYGTFTEFRTTGIKTITLGSPVITDLEAAIDAVSVFTVAIRQVDETLLALAHGVNCTPISGTNKPQLRVTHAASSTLRDIIGCGVVPFPR